MTELGFESICAFTTLEVLLPTIEESPLPEFGDHFDTEYDRFDAGSITLLVLLISDVGFGEFGDQFVIEYDFFVVD
jgi:hypothetical protein